MTSHKKDLRGSGSKKNAGRKTIPNGVRFSAIVPKDKLNEAKAFIHNLQHEAIKNNLKYF